MSAPSRADGVRPRRQGRPRGAGASVHDAQNGRPDGVSETISPLHLRAIDEEPLGSNSKFFVQCKTRVWNTDHATGNAYCGGVVEGAWDATVYQPGDAGVIAALPGRH